MSDEELQAQKKITVTIAARYLQNGTTPQEIRVQAQNGVSPYCTAERMRGRFRYRVNPGLLMAFKHGHLGLAGGGTEGDGYGTPGAEHAEELLLPGCGVCSGDCPGRHFPRPRRNWMSPEENWRMPGTRRGKPEEWLMKMLRS